MNKTEWNVGDVYHEELASGTKAERTNTLQGLAYAVETGPYTKPLSPEEIAEKKTRFTSLAMTLADFAEEEKARRKEYKEKIAGPKEEYDQLLKDIKFRQEEKNGTLYMIDNQDEKMMYIFDENAVCVDARPLKREERQHKIKHLNTASNG